MMNENIKMKTIGLVGGTGWVSSVEYYRIINETINKRLGGMNFAKCILYSFNYGEIDALNKRDDMKGVFALILDAAKKITDAGADFIVLCANTLHLFADDLAKEIPLPLVHIAEATAKEIKKKGLSTVGLLGTKPTMELDFYKTKLKEENINVIVPEKNEIDFIHSVIMNELLKEIFDNKSKVAFLEIMKKLESQGAEAIILGCTEIPLLIKQEDSHLPLFNTTVIHALAAVDFALQE